MGHLVTFANMYGGVRAPGKERNPNDSYPTPPLATYALLKHSRVPRKLWEPASGRGWMAWELQRNGHSVLATDLHAYDDTLVHVVPDNDFLNPNLIDPTAHGVVTNPPYGKNMAQKFIEKGIDNYHYVAMLCRLTFAESMTRHELFTTRPPTNIIAFSGRFSCNEGMFLEKPMQGMIAYAWWVWDANVNVDRLSFRTELSWINTPKIHKEWKESMSEADMAFMKEKIGAGVVQEAV